MLWWMDYDIQQCRGRMQECIDQIKYDEDRIDYWTRQLWETQR